MKSKFGIDVRTMLVPTASYTLRDKLPPFAPEVDQDELIQEAIDTVPNFVDVRQALKEHNQEYIYYRTDHHWTNLGVCYAYQVWCQAVGLEVKRPDWYEQKVLSDQFYGTTYSKANLYTAKPDTITAFSLPKQETSLTVDYNLGQKVTDTLYETKHLDTKDKYSVFLDGNQPITKITTSNKNGRKLMLIKDSYANSFATFAANDYEEVYLVDLRHYRAPLFQLVEETGINGDFGAVQCERLCQRRQPFSLNPLRGNRFSLGRKSFEQYRIKKKKQSSCPITGVGTHFFAKNASLSSLERMVGTMGVFSLDGETKEADFIQ